MKPLCSSVCQIDKVDSASGGSPIRPFGLNMANQLSENGFIARRNRDASMEPFSDGWFAKSTDSTFTARMWTTHKPTSHGNTLLQSVADRRRPHGRRYPTLWWPVRLETASKKAIECHFSWFLAVSLARTQPIAAVFAAVCRPAASAHESNWARCARMRTRRVTGPFTWTEFDFLTKVDGRVA